MLKKISLAFFLFAVSSQAYSRGIDLLLADELAEFTYLSETSTFGYGGADTGLGFLYTEDDDYQINGSIMVTGNPAGNNKSLQMGVGGKLVFTSIDILDEEFGALAIGGQIRYVIPASMPVAFMTSIHYAPSVTSFSGADEFREFRVAIELEVTPSARAYIGFRNMEYELENTNIDIEIDDDVHVGVKFDF